MGELTPSGKIEDVKFFKIDELAYDTKTRTWGSDVLYNNSQSHTVTIPSDIKPGTYVIRHEIIALHGAMNDNFVTKVSGAQFYPQCAKVEVTGEGTVTPAGNTFPGTYIWDEPGILINAFYMPNEYKSPGGAVYKPAKELPIKGPQPVVKDTGVLTGEQGAKYEAARAKTDSKWQNGVHNNEAGRKLNPNESKKRDFDAVADNTFYQQIPVAVDASGKLARLQRKRHAQRPTPNRPRRTKAGPNHQDRQITSIPCSRLESRKGLAEQLHTFLILPHPDGSSVLRMEKSLSMWQHTRLRATHPRRAMVLLRRVPCSERRFNLSSYLLANRQAR
jgi:hypothetical protein